MIHNLFPLLFFLFVLFSPSLAVDIGDACTCMDLASGDYTCVPFGHRVQLLSFNSAGGTADYAVCSVYPESLWNMDPETCPYTSNGNDISHFAFFTVDPVPCLGMGSYTFSMQGCSNGDRWNPTDIDTPAVTDFDSCSSYETCEFRTNNPGCGSEVNGIDQLKCDYEITKGMTPAAL